MLTCKEASRMISLHQERPLGFRERWKLWLHLLGCEYCRRFEQQLALIRKSLRMLGRRAERDTEGIDLSPDARERIRKALAEHHDHKH